MRRPVETRGWDNYESVFFGGVSPGVFHEFQVVWEPGRITYKVDGRVMGTVTENVPADYDGGGMNNVIGVMNSSDGTSVTLRSVDYQPLGAGGGGGGGSTPTQPPREEPAPAAPPPAAAEPDREEPPAPGPGSSSAGSGGGDRLVLQVSQDAFRGDATYTVAVDGVQVGGTYTASALRSSGQHDTLVLQGDWGPGEHLVIVALTNDLWEPGVGDRNLYVTGADYNGTHSDALGGSWTGGSFTVWGDSAF